MKSNPLLKWLLIPMALLLVFVGIKLFSGAPGGQPAPKGAASTLTPEEMKALGIAGDTPRDLTALPLEQLMELEVYSASKFVQRASEAPSSVTVMITPEKTVLP